MDVQKGHKDSGFKLMKAPMTFMRLVCIYKSLDLTS